MAPLLQDPGRDSNLPGHARRRPHSPTIRNSKGWRRARSAGISSFPTHRTVQRSEACLCRVIAARGGARHTARDGPRSLTASKTVEQDRISTRCRLQQLFAASLESHLRHAITGHRIRRRRVGIGSLLRRGRVPDADSTRPHLIYLAIGFPPAAKSCAYRMRETANQFCSLGWDVTVVTIREESWERESGLDHTLSEAVDPRVRIIELPLARDDLETDIRKFSETRALHPTTWAKQERERQLKFFPELVFGGWRDGLEQGVLDVHRARPADLLLVSCAPYVNLAAALRLWQEHKVPYAVDYRDGWSIDVIGGGEAFTRDSAA
ncbi:MAG: hypothetical protein QG587_27, partial [Chloroflexota bacterium]|nr:hypothetical protein [Chloroflexota bacterium]